MEAPVPSDEDNVAVTGVRQIKKKILVGFGATGLQGDSVIRSILYDRRASAQYEIRAVTRNILIDPSARKLALQDVEVVK